MGGVTKEGAEEEEEGACCGATSCSKSNCVMGYGDETAACWTGTVQCLIVDWQASTQTRAACNDLQLAGRSCGK